MNVFVFDDFKASCQMKVFLLAVSVDVTKSRPT